MAENKSVTSGDPNNPGVFVQGSIATAPNGGFNLGADVVEAETPGFLTTEYDRDVVRMGWASAPINAMTRDIGFKITRTLKYGYWVMGMRESKDTLTEEYTVTEEDVRSRKAPGLVSLTVKNPSHFDVTDEIMFKGINGVNEDGEEVLYMPCNARVVGVSTTEKKISVQFLNAKAGTVIPEDTTILILGHALAERDAKVTPHAASPEPREQYMQKFMCSAEATNMYLESDKEANWELNDLREMNSQQFIEDIEKTYIWGIRSYTTDPSTKAVTRTCAGIIQQMLEGEAHIIKLKKSMLTDETIIRMMSEVFVGNTGSTQRYFYSGMDLTTAFFSLKDVRRQINANETVRKFEFDFTRFRLFNFTLYNAPHPLLDKMGFSNIGLILDRKYVERRVFRPLNEDQKDLYDIGFSDSQEIRCCEVSSILLKYPQCHALVVYEDDTALGSDGATDGEQLLQQAGQGTL